MITTRNASMMMVAVLLASTSIVSSVHADPARLDRIRAAKMPPITEPVMFDTPEADAI